MHLFFKMTFKNLLISLFVTYAVYEKFMLPELQLPMIVAIMFVAVYGLVDQLNRRVLACQWYERISYALFSIFFVVGDSFKYYGSFRGVFGNPFRNTDLAEKLFEEFAPVFGFLDGTIGNLLMLCSALCKGVGYYFIIRYSFGTIKYLWFRCSNKNKGKITEKFFSQHKFRNIFFVLVVAWFPYFIIKFPGAICADATWQIKQFLTGTINTHHPYFTTILYGGFVKLGLLIGNVNSGIFLLVLLQYAVMAASFSYCISRTDNIVKNHLFSWILLFIFAFSPAFPSFATTLIKDGLYATVFLLYIMQILLILYGVKRHIAIEKNIVGLVIASIFVCLTRNNGIYIVGATSFFLILYFLLLRKISLRQRTLYLTAVVLPLVCYVGYHFWQYNVLDLERGSIKETLSIPFQQTARYVKEYPEEVTPMEAEIIDRVLDYEHLADLYNPIISDPVKSTYKNNDAALKDYFEVWLQQFFKHPLSYIEATIHTNYFAFYPDEPNIRAYSVLGENEPAIPGIKMLSILLLAFVMGLSMVPVLGCVINPVFYVWIFIYFSIRSIFKRNYVSFLFLIPLLVQLLTVIAGPGVFNHPRYLYPIYWSIPFIIGYFLATEKPVETLNE